MGLGKIREVMDQFALHGKASTPVAVIQNGTLPNQRVITGKVSTIVDLCSVADLGSPSIIVIGEVVNFAHALNGITQDVVIQYQ